MGPRSVDQKLKTCLEFLLKMASATLGRTCLLVELRESPWKLMSILALSIIKYVPFCFKAQFFGPTKPPAGRNSVSSLPICGANEIMCCVVEHMVMDKMHARARLILSKMPRYFSN